LGLLRSCLTTCCDRIQEHFAGVDGLRFWHDWFHDSVLTDGFRAFARFLADPVDLGVIDGIANGLAKGTRRLAGRLSLLQTGFVRNYALMLFFGVVTMLGYLIFFS